MEWLQLYHFFIEYIWNTIQRLFNVFILEHFWIAFPLIVSFVCGLVSLTLIFVFRVLKNNV